jgi:hypothetical protein
MPAIVAREKTVAVARGPQGEPGTDANVTQANIEAAITDKPGFRDELYLQAVPINVKEFGATGDGVTDDSAAIHSAIASAAAAEKAVYFPRGIYKCNLVLGSTSATSAIRLFGAGNGSTGDWATTEPAGATMLIPNNNALPIIKIEALKGIKIEDMELRGNGAGTTATGILIDAPTVDFAGNGLIVDNVNIRKCTYNVRNLGGCNMSFKQCGFFQGNYGFYVDNLPLAHSYTFDLCSIGGLAATGTSRCFHIEDGSFLNIINCEQGNCTDYLYMSGAPVVVILGGNWETYSAQELINMLGGTLTITGGRWSTGGKTILRVNGGTANIIAVTMIGMFVSGDQTVFETNDWNTPVIRGVGIGKRVKFWNSDFTSLIGESINERLSASGRLTVDQAIAGVGTHVIVFNVATLNVGSKYSTSTGRFTPGKKGRYQIAASARISGVPGGWAKVWKLLGLFA